MVGRQLVRNLKGLNPPNLTVDTHVITIPAKGGHEGNENGNESTRVHQPTVYIGLLVAPKPDEGGWPSDVPHVRVFSVFDGKHLIEAGPTSAEFD